MHAVLVRMARSGPDVTAWDVVVDSCSVRAKRGGELTGPNPTDRGKAGTKYHVVVATDGIPLAVIPSAASVHDTKLFSDLLRLAQVVCVAIGKLYADAGYDSAGALDNAECSTTAGFACVTASVPTFGKSVRRMGPGSVRSGASLSTAAPGCWPTNAWTEGTISWAGSSSPCSQPQPSSSSQTVSPGSENHA